MRRLLTVVALLAVALVAGCTADGAGPMSSPTHPAPTVTTTGSHLPPPAVSPPAPTPAVNHCAKNAAAQLVLVSISSQHAWFCEHTRTVYSTAVTTGMNTPDTHTPTGRFQIQGRNRDSVLTQSNGDTYDVKYWIPFQAPLYGFHDSSWQHFPYGSAQYKRAGSHGCVHLPLAAITHLYNWVQLGASVDIRA